MKTAIENGQALARGLRTGAGVIAPMNFSVGKIVHALMAKELTEDVKKQILEEDSK